MMIDLALLSMAVMAIEGDGPTTSGLGPFIVTAFVVAGAMLLVLMVLAAYRSLYHRASADQALVRTGRGGATAVVGGGMWVVPIFHEVVRVGLNKVKISIDRTGKDALTTADKIRADVWGSIFVVVSGEPSDIITAARMLGVVDSERINRIIGDTVTDAMRAEAMKVSFLDLNVKKREFAEAIAASVQQDLKKTGLVLDSVAITSIRQVEVDPEHVPLDVFEAEGIRNIVEIVERNREATNRIRRERQIEIQKVDVEARRRALDLDREQKEYEAEQSRQVRSYAAERDAQARGAEAEQGLAFQRAEILAAEEIDKRRISKEQALAVASASRDEATAVAKAMAARASLEAEIAKDRSVEAARIDKSQALETQEIGRLRAVAEAEVQKSVARAAQAKAEAHETTERESVRTAEETARADRARQVAVIQAEEAASKSVLAAEATRDSRKALAEALTREAEERAAAARMEAHGEAEARTIRARAALDAAESEAQAKTRLSLAFLEEGRAQAEARRMMVAAESSVAMELLLRDVAMEAVRTAPEAIRAFMEPATAIGEIKVIQMQGMGGGEGTQAGLPSLLAGSLAQAAGLLPVISALADFARETGLTSAIKARAKDAIAVMRDVVAAENRAGDDDRPET